MDIDGFGGAYDISAFDAWSVQTDVISHRFPENKRLLEHMAQPAAQIGLGRMANIQLINCDCDTLNNIEALDQVSYCAFSRADGSNHGQNLPGLN